MLLGADSPSSEITPVMWAMGALAVAMVVDLVILGLIFRDAMEDDATSLLCKFVATLHVHATPGRVHCVGRIVIVRDVEATLKLALGVQQLIHGVGGLLHHDGIDRCDCLPSLGQRGEIPRAKKSCRSVGEIKDRDVTSVLSHRVRQKQPVVIEDRDCRISNDIDVMLGKPRALLIPDDGVGLWPILENQALVAYADEQIPFLPEPRIVLHWLNVVQVIGVLPISFLKRGGRRQQRFEKTVPGQDVAEGIELRPLAFVVEAEYGVLTKSVLHAQGVFKV